MSLRKAINGKCAECIYDPLYRDPVTGKGASKTQQIEDCTATDCPLYAVRPLTAAGRRKRAQGSKQSEIMKKRHREGVFG